MLKQLLISMKKLLKSATYFLFLGIYLIGTSGFTIIQNVRKVELNKALLYVDSAFLLLGFMALYRSYYLAKKKLGRIKK